MTPRCTGAQSQSHPHPHPHRSRAPAGPARLSHRRTEATQHPACQRLQHRPPQKRTQAPHARTVTRRENPADRHATVGCCPPPERALHCTALHCAPHTLTPQHKPLPTAHFPAPRHINFACDSTAGGSFRGRQKRGGVCALLLHAVSGGSCT